MTFPDPLFVGGSGRSGTTVLGRLIGRHTRYACIPVETRFHAEPNGLPGVLEGRVTPADFVGAMHLQWWQRTDSSGREAGLDRLVTRERFEAAISDFGRVVDDDPLEAARGLVRALLDPVADAAGKASWVEMTPYNALAAVRLVELFPRAKLVHVLRDGRDVAASVHRLWGYDLRQAVDWWARRMRRICLEAEALPTGRTLCVQLEDLALRDREGAYERLCAFLELEDESGMRRFFEKRLLPDRAQVGHWREGLAPTETDRLTRHYRRALLELEETGAPWVRRLAETA